MKKIILALLTTSCLLSTSAVVSAQTKKPAPKKSTPASATAATATELKWLTFEEAEKLAEKNPKPFLIDFYTDWCGWCKVMDKKTYSQPAVIAHINKNYYPVKFNAESKSPVKFNGKQYVFKPENRAHEIAIEMMAGRLSYPTTVVLNKEKTGINPIPGYLEPAQMETILKYLEEGIGSGVTWEDWQKSFKTTW